MLHLNSAEEPLVTDESENIVWKVLIFDKFGQDVISSILRVNDLRENGVTVHMYETIVRFINSLLTFQTGSLTKKDQLYLMYLPSISSSLP